MKTFNEMVKLNKEQARYYNAIQKAAEQTSKNKNNATITSGFLKSKSANLVTKGWARLRRVHKRTVGKEIIKRNKSSLHLRWIDEKKGGRFLEIGCFTGSPMTMTLAKEAGEYVGVDLSSDAVKVLRKKMVLANLSGSTKVINTDFLLLDNKKKYDLIYAEAVLHHFNNYEILFRKIQFLLKSDGVIIFSEPSACNNFFATIRNIYRPFQSDAKWEWPFSRKTVRSFYTYFKPIEGFGWGRWSLPISVLGGLPLLGAFFSRIHVKIVNHEISNCWNSQVWKNSYVTCIARPLLKGKASNKLL